MNDKALKISSMQPQILYRQTYTVPHASWLTVFLCATAKITAVMAESDKKWFVLKILG